MTTLLTRNFGYLKSVIKNKLRQFISRSEALTSFQNIAVRLYTAMHHLFDKFQYFTSNNKSGRLRHGLNYDCLCEVFGYLSVSDLIRLCEMDVYYQNLIATHVIGKKLIDFTKSYPHWRKRKIIEVFGKSMRKIKMDKENALGDFAWFLDLVIRYCSKGRLTELQLIGFNFNEADNMEQAMPFFSNLRKLTLVQGYGLLDDRFLARTSAIAINLTHLTLEGTHLSGEWLSAGGMTKLKELRLHFFRNPINGLSEFLRTKSQLEVFICIDCEDIFPTVASTLITHCSRLKTFVDCHSQSSRSIDRMRYYYGKQFLSNQMN